MGLKDRMAQSGTKAAPAAPPQAPAQGKKKGGGGGSFFRTSQEDREKEGQSSAYIVPGNYLFRIRACKHIESRNPKSRGARFFVAELDTLWTDVEAYGPGSVLGWRQNLDKPSSAAAEKFVQCFVSAASNGAVAEDEVDDEVMGEVIGEENSLCGQLVRCNATNKQIQSGDFTVCRFSPPTEEDLAQHGTAAA